MLYCIIFILIGLCCYFFFTRQHINTNIEKENNNLLNLNKQLGTECNDLEYKIKENNEKLDNLNKDISDICDLLFSKDKELQEIKFHTEKMELHYNNILSQEKAAYERINDIYKVQEEALENKKKLTREAFENYCDNLDNDYKNKETEYNELLNKLYNVYDKKHEELMAEAAKEEKELAQIRNTRESAIEALRREKEILDFNNDEYRLDLEEKSIRDIKLLKSIQDEISNPIVIDKIIWSNYYQPLVKIKFPKIIGKETATGIYKLTNIKTGEAYIGQSSNVCDRWKTHCKNALGVGNVVNVNKLYKSMREYGLYNFTFELLEECNINELDSKEKYYIDFYNAYNFGLNSTKGNG